MDAGTHTSTLVCGACTSAYAQIWLQDSKAIQVLHWGPHTHATPCQAEGGRKGWQPKCWKRDANVAQCERVRQSLRIQRVPCVWTAKRTPLRDCKPQINTHTTLTWRITDTLCRCVCLPGGDLPALHMNTKTKTPSCSQTPHPHSPLVCGPTGCTLCPAKAPHPPRRRSLLIIDYPPLQHN